MQQKQACWNGGGLSLRRDVTAAHSQEDDHNEALKVFLQQTGMSKTVDIQKPHPRR
jgi:hypothetical protein